MKFFTAKNNSWFCFQCGTQILADEHCCGFPNKNKTMLMFHPGCYVTWFTENFNSKYQKWLMEQIGEKGRHWKKNKLGRPRIYKNPYRARNLQSLICYYRKVGNQDKVQELEHTLRELEIRREQ